MKKMTKAHIDSGFRTYMVESIDMSERSLMNGCIAIFRFNLQSFNAYKAFCEELRWVWENKDMTDKEYFRYGAKAAAELNKRQRKALTAWKKVMHC